MIAAYVRNDRSEGLAHTETVGDRFGLRELGKKLIRMAESRGEYDDSHWMSVTGGSPFSRELI